MPEYENVELDVMQFPFEKIFIQSVKTLHIIPKADEDTLLGAPDPLPSKLYTCLKLQFGAVFQSMSRVRKIHL
ncbi:hypothetical protein T4B_8564 [Trichinella pseudospiralis]|uniref:Uncharacterized protein n=1 Tax=Trichinella pseudospiralis TaxID=6337 RepID=A0A0V1J5I4_TRIPS|nr:hypothetical protein T4B_8564 [Trichinella pseudospiralis]